MTTDHKPELSKERARINEAGGLVLKIPGSVPYRVFGPDPRKGPGLAMSRAMGDLMAHQCGVCCDPDISEFKIDSNLRFIMLCSDGVWEFLKNKTVGNIMFRGGPKNISQKAFEIAELSKKKWDKYDGTVVDDITCVCLWFREGMDPEKHRNVSIRSLNKEDDLRKKIENDKEDNKNSENKVTNVDDDKDE